MSEETLQMAEERREGKSKGESERDTQLNAEFQRIARGHKNAFLSEQWKEVEENNTLREISSKKLEIQREYVMQRWAQKWTKMAKT